MLKTQVVLRNCGGQAHAPGVRVSAPGIGGGHQFAKRAAARKVKRASSVSFSSLAAAAGRPGTVQAWVPARPSGRW